MAELTAQRHHQHVRDPYGVILLVLALAALVVGLAMLVAGHKPAPRLSSGSDLEARAALSVDV